MKNYLKRTTTFFLALLMLLSVPLQAFAHVNYENLTDEKDKIVNNKVPVKPAKTDNAEKFIKNPAQPAIYTLRTDFKVPVESKRKISYQPYIASVGEKVTQTEKDKVKKTIPMPIIAGFTPPDDEDDFSISYDDIVDEAKNATKTEDKVNGDRYTANQEFRYREISETIQVKDVFQDITDFNKYEPKPGTETRPVSGSTASALQVPALQDYEIKGFVPEERLITVQLPDDTDGYIVEYRYNRAHYEVTFDTDGGTPVQAREFFYGQKIPTLDASELPTKDGFKLSGWTASPTLKDANGNPYTAGHLKSDLSGGLIMPAERVTFKAVWQADSSAKAVKTTTKPAYAVKLDYGDGKTKTNTVNNGDNFAKPSDPNRKGYTFMGWAWLDKNSAGKVLYSFNNKVTSDINLKALWVKNDRVDLDIYHYFLDKDGNLDKSQYPNPLKENLYDKRVGNYSTTVGDQISDKYTLASPDDIKDANIKSIFETYNNKYKSNNSFFQTIMVEANNSNGANTFNFFYKPFRTREYKVNYIDERFKNDSANGAIIPQELVENGNRHYDARNYRPIPGWKLVSDPQQQLFFDIDEKTNEFKGINGTGKDEITFYYKDVRVIEVSNKNDPVPEGYVRVTFKADNGGAFIDKAGNSKTELYYDVIKGLKSQFLPVPQELKEGDTKEEGKYYITSDNGRSFKEWADSPLLNSNTDIQQDYSFTAKFDWSGLTAKPMVVTEAFKDANGKWTNYFAPTLADLKNQIVWMENEVEQALPSDATVTFEGITKDEDIYEKLKELGVSDKDQVFRIVTFKAKVEFKDKKNTKELEIPVKVYKNRYEALTSGDKPLPLSEAEKNDLKDILSGTAEKRYVKVTVNPSNKPDNKDSKIYYVNPKAWVDIPEIKLTAEDKAKLKFLNWTSDNDDVNTDGKYIFEKENVKQRYKFTKDTIISPVSAEDVIEQKGNDKPNVPESYVKVIVKTTDNATDQTKFERTFWVDPLNKVEISVDKPIGKIVETDTTKYTLTFSKWQTEDKSKSWTDKILGQFEKETTILAKYSTGIQDIKVQKPTADVVDTPQGKVPTLDEIKEKIKAPEGKTIASVEYITNGEPDVSKDGKAEAKVIVKYTDGSKVGSNDNPLTVPVEVHKNIIPSYDGKMPEGALKNYVKITFKAGEGGTITDGKKQAYFVSPEVEVDMTSIAEAITKNPNTGYINGDWDTSKKKLKDTFTTDTKFIFNFKKTDDIVKVTDSGVQKPKDYAELIFSTDGNGKLDDNKDKITYYVNPKAGIKIVNGTAGDKQISVPTPKANSNYEFEKWREDLNLKDPITADRHYVAGFKLTNVTLTYDAGGGKGQGPASKTVKYGTKEFLANQEKLTKENYNFIGWKLSTDNTDKIYQPGEDIILKENTTATAQWKIIQHTVKFNTMGGSPIDSQEVDHGSTAKKPETNPTRAGFVFMGWKEEGKESEQDYYNFNTPITKDKTLVAIWEKAVQKINENDPVGEEFIKVTFKEGRHGKLAIDDTEQTDSPTYKVGKDLSFEDAVEYGLVVPTIKAKEYYKAQAENNGWDKAQVLNRQDITFTAKYEIESNVIPIKPEKTDKQIKDEKPEGMIVVDFKVEPNKFYMVGTTKFYVKIRELVNITPPVVLNRDTKFVFKGWTNANVVDDKINQTFTEDYTITDAEINELDLIITIPKEGQSRVFIEKLSGQKGKLQVISDGSNTSYENSTFRRRGKTYDVFNLDSPLKVGDILKYWAEDENRSSLPKQEMVK